MRSFSWDGLRALVVIIFGIVTTVLWILCIWQLVLRFKPESSAPPPICKNNGDYQNGDCHCPEEWRGLFCEIANFCTNSTYRNSSSQNSSESLSFTITVVDRYGYSEEKCEEYTANAGAPKARGKCRTINGKPTLTDVHVVNCNENLSSLMNQLNTVNNSVETIQSIADSTQFLTSEPEKLTIDNITSAALIAQTILKDYSEANEAAVVTVSQLLSANDSEFKHMNNSLINITAGLTKTLEEFSLGYNAVEPQIAIQNIPLTYLTSYTTTTRFIAQAAGLGSLNHEAIQVVEDVSGFANDSNTAVEILINVTANNSSGNGRIGFVLYQNDKFFQSEKYQSRFNHTKHIIASHVVNATVNDVKIAFKPQYNTSEIQLHDYACVFWDYDANDWSTTGCTKDRNNSVLQCRCNHNSSFAILMFWSEILASWKPVMGALQWSQDFIPNLLNLSSQSFQLNYTYAEPLEIISYIGSGVSIAGLAITILFQILTRKTRKFSVTWMLVSLCTSMLIFNIIFISGIENPNDMKNGSDMSSKYNSIPKSDRIEPPEDVRCTAVALLLHYFLLATFVWTALNAGYLYMLLLKTLKPLPEHLTVIMSLIGWGAPAVVVAVTLGATYRVGSHLKYRREEFCWLAALDEKGNMSPEKPMFWAFLLLVAVILLFDIIIFVRITVSVMWMENKDLTSNKKKSLKNKIFGTLSIAVVLGVTWILGYFMLIEHQQTNTAFRFLFCIFNATQGLQICILYTFRSPIFKKKVNEMLSIVPLPSIPTHLHSNSYYLLKFHSKKHKSEIFQLCENFSEETTSYSTSYPS